MRRRCPDRLARLCLALLVLVLAAAKPAAAQFDAAAVRAHIVDLLATEPSLPLPIRQRGEPLDAYYRGQGGQLLWLAGDRGAGLVARLRDAAADGLAPEDYPSEHLARLADAIGSTDERSLAIIELFHSAALLEYVSDLHVGRVLPNKVDPNFFLGSKPFDAAGALADVAAFADMEAYFAASEPRSPEYAGLKAALAAYRNLAATGGWGVIPLGETLRPDMIDPRVPALRDRLSLTDGAPAVAAAETELSYGPDLVESVKRFQARHGLDVDGVIGPATLVALNVPVEDRIGSIRLAMERWRWMPEDLGRQHIIVNIAGFELRRYADGSEAERMNVVVGRPYSRTPVFSDRIRYLEFNPYWTAPNGIALNEELPKLRRDPASLAAQGFEAIAGGQAYDVRAIDWSRYGPGNFPFQLRQRPGPANALGRVKFMFPNAHDVYLHDTPSRSLFARAERAFSHGCVRVARPLELADQVLRAGGVEGWDAARIDRVVASQANTVVDLATPLPVHITYLTAWADAGTVNFRGDIYEHDHKLVAALEGHVLAW